MIRIYLRIATGIPSPCSITAIGFFFSSEIPALISANMGCVVFIITLSLLFHCNALAYFVSNYFAKNSPATINRNAQKVITIIIFEGLNSIAIINSITQNTGIIAALAKNCSLNSLLMNECIINTFAYVTF